MISTKYLKKILFYSAVTLGGVSLICGVGWGAIFFRILLVSVEWAAAGSLCASAATGAAAIGVAKKLMILCYLNTDNAQIATGVIKMVLPV